MKRGRKIFFVLILLIIVSFVLYRELAPTNTDNFVTCPSYILDSNTTTNGNLTVSYLNVSQGDSIFISNGNQNMLIDCGPNGMGTRISDYLKNHQVTQIDYLIVTHSHADHIGGCEEILKNFNVQKVIMNGKPSDTQSYKDVMKLIKNENLITATNCFNANLGASEWQVIHSNINSDNENQNSIVLSMKYGKTGFLFMADCDSGCEQSLLKQELNTDFLKIPHHGSEYGTTDEFLEKTTPRGAFIEVGKNSYGHPSPVCLTRLQNKRIQILRTDINGTTTLKTDGENYWIYSEN